MAVLGYILPAIISVLGLLSGVIVGIIAKEELVKGKKYFVFFQKILFLIIIILFMYLFRTEVYSLLFGVLAFILYFHYFKKIESWMVYLSFGIMYHISFGKVLFPFLVSFMFLYGLPTGSLELKNKIKLVICSVVFLIVSIGLYLL